MNYDTIFFCQDCRKPQPVQDRVVVRTKPTRYRCTSCSAQREEHEAKKHAQSSNTI